MNSYKTNQKRCKSGQGIPLLSAGWHKAIKKAAPLVVIFISLLLAVLQAQAQVGGIHTNVVSGAPPPPGPITGPTSITTPTASGYSVPAIAVGITLNWSLSPSTAGTISASINQATVTWNHSFGGAASVIVTATNSSGTSVPSILNVTVAVPLASGTASGTQTINYGTTPPIP